MKQSECGSLVFLSRVSLSLLQLPLYHESKFKAIAISVDNLATGLDCFPGPAGTSHPEWIKIKLRKIKEFGSLHAAPADLQLHQCGPTQLKPGSLVEF